MYMENIVYANQFLQQTPNHYMLPTNGSTTWQLTVNKTPINLRPLFNITPSSGESQPTTTASPPLTPIILPILPHLFAATKCSIFNNDDEKIWFLLAVAEGWLNDNDGMKRKDALF